MRGQWERYRDFEEPASSYKGNDEIASCEIMRLLASDVNMQIESRFNRRSFHSFRYYLSITKIGRQKSPSFSYLCES